MQACIGVLPLPCSYICFRIITLNTLILKQSDIRTCQTSLHILAYFNNLHEEIFNPIIFLNTSHSLVFFAQMILLRVTSGQSRTQNLIVRGEAYAVRHMQTYANSIELLTQLTWVLLMVGKLENNNCFTNKMANMKMCYQTNSNIFISIYCK